jgi:hypothetical protein
LPDEVTLAGGDLASHATKPWARHDTGVRRNFLWLQYKRASRHEDKGYCLGTTEKEGTCLACDSCETEEDTAGLVHQRTRHETDAQGFAEALKARKKGAVPIAMAMHWEKAAAGLPRKYPGLAVASAMMRVQPDLTQGFWRHHSCWAPAEGDKCHAAGEDILTLEWQPEAAEKVMALLADPIFLAEANALLQGWGRIAGLADFPSGQPPAQPAAWVFLSPYAPNLQGYAQAKSLAFTQSRRGSGWQAAFSKDAVKKKWVRLAEWDEVPGEGMWRLRVHPLEKFQIELFLREAFRLPDPSAWARIEVSAEGLWGNPAA